VRPRSADSLPPLSAELRERTAPPHRQIEGQLRLPGAIRTAPPRRGLAKNRLFSPSPQMYYDPQLVV
jgi:hypothetical protein